MTQTNLEKNLITALIILAVIATSLIFIAVSQSSTVSDLKEEKSDLDYDNFVLEEKYNFLEEKSYQLAEISDLSTEVIGLFSDNMNCGGSSCMIFITEKDAIELTPKLNKITELKKAFLN